MTHTTPNPHDAEEALRPLLGDLFEAALRFGGQPRHVSTETFAYIQVQNEVIHKCFEMLGINHLS